MFTRAVTMSECAELNLIQLMPSNLKETIIDARRRGHEKDEILLLAYSQQGKRTLVVAMVEALLETLP